MLHAAASLRLDYARMRLDRPDLDSDPIRQFQAWFDQALAAQLREPNAMTLATVGADGRPSARIVLLKGVDDGGFLFFTNYESRKGRELAAHPFAALVLFWPELERQVRIEGRVERTSAEISDAYYHSRPLEARLGAWSSQQSEVLPDRAALEQHLAEIRARFEGVDPPRPEFWGGFRLVPDAIEFWQGRPSRLHDRFLYRRDPAQMDRWTIDRLSP